MLLKIINVLQNALIVAFMVIMVVSIIVSFA
jgi:hypothetical protein